VLAAGLTYDDIARRTGASSATISRVRRFLEYGADGYRVVLDRLARSRS
jgi:TrpR-related protein YerC/YecD